MSTDQDIAGRLRDTAAALAEADWTRTAGTVREGAETIERLREEREWLFGQFISLLDGGTGRKYDVIRIIETTVKSMESKDPQMFGELTAHMIHEALAAHDRAAGAKGET